MLEYKRSMKMFKHRRSMKGVPVRTAMQLRRHWLKDSFKRRKSRPLKSRALSLALWRSFNWRVHASIESPF